MLENLTPAFRKILGNTGWLLVDRVLRMGVGLFVGVWVARYLGPALFGSLNFALAFVALLGSAATLGLDSLVVRDLVLENTDIEATLGTTLALRLGGAVLAVLISVGAIVMIQPGDHLTIILVSITATGLIFQAFDTIDSFFQSQIRSKLTVWAKNIAFLVIACLKVWLIHKKAPVWTFAVSGVAELALGAVGLVFVYSRSGGNMLKWRAKKRLAINLLSQGWPLILSSMAVMIYMRIDMVMLKVMQGDAAAGLYAAATRISEVWYFIPLAIVSSVSPAIIRSKTNPALYFGRLRKLFSVMVLLSVVIGSGIAFASPWIVRILYSGNYQAAAPVLAVHIWASVFVFLGIAQGPWNVSENLLKLSLYRTAAGAVANVALNLYLIPKYSALGAAIATVVSYAIAGVIANGFDARTRPIFFLQLKSFLP
jgi:polysaccharide transporter, PST family